MLPNNTTDFVALAFGILAGVRTVIVQPYGATESDTRDQAADNFHAVPSDSDED